MRYTIEAQEYRRRRWYSLGADRTVTAGECHMAMQDGSDCYRAFIAGVMARLFGVDLSGAL